MKHIKSYKIFETGLNLDSMATQFINDLSRDFDLRLGEYFDKEKANCSWFTSEFVNWSQKNNIDTKIIYFDSDIEAHIAPLIDGKVLDFAVKQFTKNPKDDYLILTPNDYKIFGYNDWQILEKMPDWVTIREADPI